MLLVFVFFLSLAHGSRHLLLLLWGPAAILQFVDYVVDYALRKMFPTSLCTLRSLAIRYLSLTTIALSTEKKNNTRHYHTISDSNFEV